MTTSLVGTTETVGAATAGTAAPPERRDTLFHPIVDFLCLGGLSLVLLPMFWLMPETSAPTLALAALLVADFLNHPHFAHSYQIFYRGFAEKVTGRTIGEGLRIRYLVAGIAVPVALVLFFAFTWWRQDARSMGYAGNVMLFLVGWHYTKQGYGMLMVDAAFKRRFFNDREKRIFVANAHTSWIFYWIGANWFVKEYQLWGLNYYALPIPRWLLMTSGATMAATTLLMLITFAQVLRGGRRLPWNGVLAYLVSIYLWTVGQINPMLLIFIPAFHSLQYLLVVWRFELNRATALVSKEKGASGVRVRLLSFVGVGILLGLVGFWWLPKLLDAQVLYHRETLGGTAFLFMFWIFINVHHYFIDNVIWRRENPETKQYLFG